MLVKEATDHDLRQLIFAHPFVIVKFLDESCTFCKLLAPPYEKFSNNPKYKHILFLRIDSGENPIAKKEIGDNDMPFFNIYKAGRLIECGSFKTEEGVKALLDKLS